MGACVIVLGMHRSGTSLLAGALHEAGVYLGHCLNTPFPLNPKGLWEAPSILYMQDNLLQHNAGSWQDPPQAPLEWGKLHSSVRDLFIESRQGQPVWGFKDPRTLWTLEGWLDVLDTVRPIGIFRHPASVAASLEERNGIPFEDGLKLWVRYNNRLLHFRHMLGLPLVEYTGAGPAMERQLAGAIGKVVPEAPATVPFYDASLYRKPGDDSRLSREARDLLDVLRDEAHACAT